MLDRSEGSTERVLSLESATVGEQGVATRLSEGCCKERLLDSPA